MLAAWPEVPELLRMILLGGGCDVGCRPRHELLPVDKTGVVKFTEAFAFQGALVALFAYLGFA